MKIQNKPVLLFLRENCILVVLILLATFLRTYLLSTHGIFFFDAGHDLLAAHQSISDGTIPLAGITSSRPWLHQGPVSIWIEMLVMLVFGTSTLAQHVMFTLLGIAAIIGLYELVTIHLSKKAAYFAVALIAVFPLAVSNSRMPYHTTPIPLATVLYLWTLTELWKEYSLKKTVIALLAGVLLFQFELCTAPLLLLIPYIFWRKKYALNRKIVLLAIGAGLLGFIPQVLFHLMGGSNQLVEFAKWFVTQILERLQGGSITVGSIDKTLSAFWEFGGRIFGVDSFVLSIVGFVTTGIAAGFAGLKLYAKKLPVVVELSLLGFLLLTGAYFVAGPPSEAYFPPYFILIPILVGYLFSVQKPNLQIASAVGVFIFICINTFSIFTANFFVMNGQAFQYDSIGEHLSIAKTLHAHSNQKPYILTTSEKTELEIPAFFDHIKWLTLAEGLTQPSSTGRLYYLEKNSDLEPANTIRTQKFPTKTLYWDPASGKN